MVSAAADPGSFQRGQDYYLAGRVGELRIDGAAVSAIVDGGRAYRVRLDLTPLGLEGRCNCLYGAEGFFCKHCVAAALAVAGCRGPGDAPACPDLQGEPG